MEGSSDIVQDGREQHGGASDGNFVALSFDTSRSTETTHRHHHHQVQKPRTTTTREGSIEMGEYNNPEYVGVSEANSPRVNDFKKVSVLPLVFIIFYEVSGGPFGVEESVQESVQGNKTISHGFYMEGSSDSVQDGREQHDGASDGNSVAPSSDTSRSTESTHRHHHHQVQEPRTTTTMEGFIEMGEYNDPQYVRVGEASSPRVNDFKKVSVLPLVFLIFYEVSGGPIGVEDIVRAAGPLLALIGFLVFPFIWSVPEALITAEMGTMFPVNGGYVVWVSSALGPYWGFQVGWVKWLSGVIDNALYPVLFLDYLKSAIPALGNGVPRIEAMVALTLLLTYLNYRGLTIVGWVAIFLGIFSFIPFVVMGLVAIPKLKPSRWLVVSLHNVNWNLYLNTLFWNLNYWDSISTIAGEVENPKKTLPRALFYAFYLVVVAYFFPLLIGTGAVPLDPKSWTDGYFSDIAKIVGGVWLRWWIQGAAAMSNMGMFVAEMSSDSFQLLGMAERGMLPECFGKRSRYGTPVIGILFSASGVLLLSWLSFLEIVAAENFLYCVGMILEFIAFIRLRMKYPAASRPYKIPIGTVGAVLLCTLPTLLIGVVLALSKRKVVVVSLIALVIGLVMQPCLKYVERKRWMKFSIKL